MIVQRIYEWAHVEPNKTAIISNDTVISYAAFARAIEAARQFFVQQNLPSGRTAIVPVQNHAAAWIIVLALRALGLNTICVRSISAAEELDVRDVACVVGAQVEQPTYITEGNALARTKLVVLPGAHFENINTGDVPCLTDNASHYGDHILCASGTTGRYKQILLSSLTEEDRNSIRAADYRFNMNTVAYSGILSAGFSHTSRLIRF
jgi:non-ribosomal peptide synthetase component E (peptide arylation enzyme)